MRIIHGKCFMTQTWVTIWRKSGNRVEIASAVDYDNPDKVAAAFKEIFGMALRYTEMTGGRT